MTHRDDAIELMNELAADISALHGPKAHLVAKLRDLRAAFEMACPPPQTERVLECSTCEQPHGTPIQAVETAGRMECPWCLDRNNLRARGGR